MRLVRVMVAQGGPPLALAPAGLRQEKRKGAHASLGGATAQGSPLPLALAGLGQRLGEKGMRLVWGRGQGWVMPRWRWCQVSSIG